jgi:polyhydroxyalkanoate synthesis regulator phasin
MRLSKNTQIGAVIVAIGLAAAAGAFAATKLRHHTTQTASPGLRTGVVAARSLRGFGAPMLMRRGDDLETAASYLGLSQQELLDQLRSGKTLAQIADATSGKSASGLVDALVKQMQDELAQAVKDGRLSQDDANRFAQDLKARITARVNGTRGVPRFGGPPGFFRHGDRGTTL